MLNKILEEKLLEVFKIEETDELFGALWDITEESYVTLPSVFLMFLEEYKYIYENITEETHLLIYCQEKDIMAQLIKPDGNKAFKTVAKDAHYDIDYVLYMLNSRLKKRGELKKSLTVIKGGKR